MLLFCRVLHRTYRLVCLRSTTPEELYARKVKLFSDLNSDWFFSVVSSYKIYLQFWNPFLKWDIEIKVFLLLGSSNFLWHWANFVLLFQIEHEEYGEALVLAQTYGLDSDLVYQKQWRKSRVSVASIHDYLVHVINNENFVLVYLKVLNTRLYRCS